jgi:DNA-binding transcriptional ArsR family regulator
MLDIGLIQERPALRTEFRVTLAASILSSMSLVLDAPSIEGLDQWVYSTHSALSEELLTDMAAVLILSAKSTIYSGWVLALPRDAEVHRDFSAYVAWLNSFGADDYQRLLDGFFEMVEAHCDRSLPEDDLPARLESCLGEKLTSSQIERVMELSSDAGEFKSQLISVITRFWERFYRQEFARGLPLMDRSVAYHRSQSYSADFPTVFVDVTGRRFPRDDDKLESAEHVIFVPSCHIGPYVMVSHCDEEGSEVIIHYNARPTGAPEGEEAHLTGDLFPPLKALADETRLQILSLLNGRELYAQQIVDELDISQSAVSRHLRLMVAGGVLDVRKVESMKYYAINVDALAALADGLSKFRAS